jgi:MraZ protein
VAGLLPPSHPGSKLAFSSCLPLIFRGTFDHTLDSKHRLTVPAKFRAALAGGAVLALSHEVDEGSPRSIAIWPAADYEAFVTQTLAGLNPLSPRARELKRFFFNTSFDGELDSANRLMMPPALMRYADLHKDVVVTGSGECIEVWNRDAYYGYREDVMGRIPEIAASLGDTA